MRGLLGEFKSGERHICELMAVPRSSDRYRSRRDDSQAQEHLRELAREHPRFAYRRPHLYLSKEMTVNHKKMLRVCRNLGLSVKRTHRQPPEGLWIFGDSLVHHLQFLPCRVSHKILSPLVRAVHKMRPVCVVKT